MGLSDPKAIVDHVSFFATVLTLGNGLKEF